MITLRIALDWTPNINHIGIFVAKELGFYNDKGINLEIISPLDDNYKLTPGKKLENDIADFCIAPFETVISLNNKKNKIEAVAIYAILQEDLSSIASLKSKNLDSPKFLDGKTYASYKARYEDKIVKELVKKNGGNGNFKIDYPEKLGIWNTLLEGKADATWIFNNWEGVEAEGNNISLNKWSLQDYDIPYGYSPVIITKKETLNSFKNQYKAFIEATRNGYLFTSKNKEKVIEILGEQLTEYDKKNIDLKKALDLSTPYFGDNYTCGRMNPKRVESFLNWIVENQLENKVIKSQTLFSNELL